MVRVSQANNEQGTIFPGQAVNSSQPQSRLEEPVHNTDQPWVLVGLCLLHQLLLLEAHQAGQAILHEEGAAVRLRSSSSRHRLHSHHAALLGLEVVVVVLVVPVVVVVVSVVVIACYHADSIEAGH